MSQLRDEDRPIVVVMSGPNGAGKTTTAARLLPELGILHFVNADDIARGLSAFDPESVAVTAGRLMLARIDELARRRESFAFETNMAARSFAPLLRDLRSDGYVIHVIYIWLRDPALAIARVAERVSRGGHSVPDEVVRRRFWAGLRNLYMIYIPLADAWRLYDNTERDLGPVAYRAESGVVTIVEANLWQRLERESRQQ